MAVLMPYQARDGVSGTAAWLDTYTADGRISSLCSQRFPHQENIPGDGPNVPSGLEEVALRLQLLRTMLRKPWGFLRSNHEVHDKDVPRDLNHRSTFVRLPEIDLPLCYQSSWWNPFKSVGWHVSRPRGRFLRYNPLPIGCKRVERIFLRDISLEQTSASVMHPPQRLYKR